MSTGLLVWCLVLAFVGLNLALIVWITLRLSVGAAAAQLGFYIMLASTCWAIFSLVP